MAISGLSMYDACMTSTLDGIAREQAETRAHELVRAWDGRAIGLGGLLGRIGSVDQVGVEERAASLAKRSIKRESKRWALDLVIRMIDLTTLEGKDTTGKIHALCQKARRPDPSDPAIPSVAAVCVYPARVADAREALAGSGHPRRQRGDRLPVGPDVPGAQVARDACGRGGGRRRDRHGHRPGAFLAGDYGAVFDEIVAVKAAAGEAHLKVILETGELGTYDDVRRASVLAMAAGADFIKTSTGKVTPAATLPVTLVMLEAIRDFERRTGRAVGMKPAGGIRTSKEAIAYLTVLYETLGPRWMTPDLLPLRSQHPAQRRAHAAAQGTRPAATPAATTSRSIEARR